MNFDKVASKESIEKAIAALKNNGIDAIFVASREEAKEKALGLIPTGASVMNMTSVTLDTLGISKEIVESGKYDSIRARLMKMDSKKDGKEMKKLGAVPDVAIGSVHAVTENGEVLIASASGSQLPAYVYGAEKVIWVVGGQKIVKDKVEGIQRIYKYTLLLESERARKAYGVPGSSVNKLLVVNKESQVGRISMIIINDVLGY